MLPISCIIKYNPIEYTDDSFESSLRHIPEYDNLLTEIEKKSKILADMLNEIRERVDKDRIKLVQKLYDDSKYYQKELVSDEIKTHEYGNYCRDMLQTITLHVQCVSEEVRNSLMNNETYIKAEELYEDIYMLMDDKYNEFDKYYLDDILWVQVVILGSEGQ